MVAEPGSPRRIQRRTVEEIVDVPVPQDDDNKDQLSNTDARIEAVEKSISKLHESVMKETEARQKQHSEVVTSIANNAAATEFFKLVVNKLHFTDEVVKMPVTLQKQVPVIQEEQKTVDAPQVQCTDKIVGVPVTAQRRVPTIQTAQRSVEVSQMIEETTEVPKIVSQHRIPQRTAEQVMDIPVPQIVEEFTEVFKAFFQNRVQQ